MLQSESQPGSQSKRRFVLLPVKSTQFTATVSAGGLLQRLTRATTSAPQQVTIRRLAGWIKNDSFMRM
ncbi:hypothetical protein E2C01_026975 [Portunus trituberculatus]|uniref:Uncharacterized protein n=1 Tax=Portunus trituberculatus TaxID=210409 RepID=A0A5B7EGR0_PORTR|nr:hypothetical protein [Portunus trituberculatus]